MIGTRLDATDEPRLIKSSYGWWFIGNRTWTLLRHDQATEEGVVDNVARQFLEEHGAFAPREPRSYSLTVLTSTACNLGCAYCFQNTGPDDSGGNKPPRISVQRLRSETIGEIANFTADRMQKARLSKLFLLLFGGEPLLNPSGCIELLDRMQDIGLYDAAMTTNGTLLTRQLAYELYARKLRSIQVTFDGSREDHDRTRVTHTGGETFDDILANVVIASKVAKFTWNFRINVSEANVERIALLPHQLSERVEPNTCTLTFAWVGDAGIGFKNNLEHSRIIEDYFVDWHTRALDLGFNVARPSMKTTCQICTVPGGSSGAVVNSDGALYSCWQSAGKVGLEVGDVRDGYFEIADCEERWVRCGYEYAQPDPDVRETFQNNVDGRVMDAIYERGLL